MYFYRFIFFLLVSSISLSVCAQWNGNVNSGGIIVFKNKSVEGKSIAFTDGSGGTIQVYENYYPSPFKNKILLQHTDSAGNLLWGSINNQKVLYEDSSIYSFPELLDAKSDNAGGAYILYIATPTSGSLDSFEVYLQHIDHTGDITWPGNGIGIMTGYLLVGDYAFTAKLAVDSIGNSFVTWYNERTQYYYKNLSVQKISPAGTRLWMENGIQVCADNSGKGEFINTPDNRGGIFIIFEDARNGIYDSTTNQFNNWEIYAQHINGSGVRDFESNGIIAADIANQNMRLTYQDGMLQSIVTGDDGSCYFFYISINNDEIYTSNLQKLNIDGQKPWGSNGIVTSAENEAVTLFQVALYKIPGRGVASIYYGFEQQSGEGELWLQCYNTDGLPVYNRVKKITRMVSGYQQNVINLFDATFESDGSALFFFIGDSVNQIPKLQKVEPDGGLTWDSTGKTIINQQACMVKMIKGNNGYATLHWLDNRNHFDSDLNDAFISRVTGDGELPVARNTFVSIADGNWNNPLTWNNNSVPGPEDIVVILSNVAITANASCYSISIQEQGNITVNSGINFTILH